MLLCLLYQRGSDFPWPRHDKKIVPWLTSHQARNATQRNARGGSVERVIPCDQNAQKLESTNLLAGISRYLLLVLHARALTPETIGRTPCMRRGKAS